MLCHDFLAVVYVTLNDFLMILLGARYVPGPISADVLDLQLLKRCSLVCLALESAFFQSMRFGLYVPIRGTGLKMHSYSN